MTSKYFPLRPIPGDVIRSFVPSAAACSGRNDKALRKIIQQENLPGSRAARADVRRMRKPRAHK